MSLPITTRRWPGAIAERCGAFIDSLRCSLPVILAEIRLSGNRMCLREALHETLWDGICRAHSPSTLDAIKT